MWGRTATDLAAGIRAREFSAREVMGAYLERIEEMNPRVNAIVTLLDRELALQAGRRGRRPGPLHGLPIAVKDLEDTAGMRTTYGSPLFARPRARSRTRCWSSGCAPAGAVIIGKTNTPEFGAGSQTFNAVFGATRNPYDLTQDARRVERRRRGGGRVRDAPVRRRLRPRRERPQPGGVLQPRRPAPLARPDPDAGPGDPWNPFPVLRRDRPQRRTDVALLLSALAGPDPRDPLSIQEPWPFPADLDGCDPRGLRIAWSRDLGGLPVEPEVTAVLEQRAGRRSRRSAASSRTPSRTSAAPTSASRCCAA